MIPLATLRQLYNYNYWARDRQLEACRALTEEQFLRPMASSFSSLRDTLWHLALGEWLWLERWRGRSPRLVPPAEEFPTLAAIEERWRAVEQEMRAYLAELKEEEMARPLTYVNLKGETWTYPLWKTLYHLTNHQTYHRGQVTTLLRQLGAPPPQVDFPVWVLANMGPAPSVREGEVVVPLETFRTLFDYNYWARDRQLEACATLTEEQFLRPMGNSFSSLRDTLAHLVAGEWVWLEKWQGRSTKTILPAGDFPTLAAVRERWAEVERGVREFLARLDEPGLARPLVVRDTQWTLGQTLYHLTNHQTYHRGQVTTLLRQLGARPPQVDFLVYLDTRK